MSMAGERWLASTHVFYIEYRRCKLWERLRVVFSFFGQLPSVSCKRRKFSWIGKIGSIILEKGYTVHKRHKQYWFRPSRRTENRAGKVG